MGRLRVPARRRHSERLGTMGVDDALQALGDLRDRLLVGDLLPLIRPALPHPLQRHPQPLGMVVDLRRGRALVTDVFRQHRVVVLFDLRHHTVLGGRAHLATDVADRAHVVPGAGRGLRSRTGWVGQRHLRVLVMSGSFRVPESGVVRSCGVDQMVEDDVLMAQRPAPVDGAAPGETEQRLPGRQKERTSVVIAQDIGRTIGAEQLRERRHHRCQRAPELGVVAPGEPRFKHDLEPGLAHDPPGSVDDPGDRRRVTRRLGS